MIINTYLPSNLCDRSDRSDSSDSSDQENLRKKYIYIFFFFINKKIQQKTQNSNYDKTQNSNCDKIKKKKKLKL